MPKYDPLRRFLRRQRLDVVEMSFTDIERQIGALLPKSAQRPQWWANEASDATAHVQCRAWREAGYDAFPTVDRETVRFQRVDRA